MDKHLVETFVTHPDWPLIEEFIITHFNNETDIEAIDATLPSSVVHAEVIARQRIQDSIRSLQALFKSTRERFGREPVSYK